MDLTELQQQVIDAATTELSEYVWFKPENIYLDNIWNDEDINTIGFDDAVNSLVADNIVEFSAVLYF